MNVILLRARIECCRVKVEDTLEELVGGVVSSPHQVVLLALLLVGTTAAHNNNNMPIIIRIVINTCKLFITHTLLNPFGVALSPFQYC